MATGSAGKSGTGGLIIKSTSGKSGSVMNFGNRTNNSSSATGKTSASSNYVGKNNSTGSFSDNKSSTANFGGKSSSSSVLSGKNSAASFGGKTNSTPTFGGKNSTTASFGEIGGSSKSQKVSSGSFPAMTTEKSNYSPSYLNPKHKKSSMTFGLIWLPTRKRNKMKDPVYNSYNQDRRDRSKERTPSMYNNYMSGDSPDNQKFKKKEEETDPLVPDRLKVPMATAAVASDELPPDIESTREKSDEKQEFIKHNEEESKEAAGDSYEKNDKDDYLENKDPTNKATDATWEKDKVGDKVDSVYLHPPPPHKARSTASTVEDEDCGIKCLYYTLQCCDCVLM